MPAGPCHDRSAFAQTIQIGSEQLALDEECRQRRVSYDRKPGLQLGHDRNKS